jgi:STE24 endopeptidase
VIPVGAQLIPGARFDPVVATNAYLATVPVAAREKSDAYFEGGYWLLLWGTLVTVLVSLLLLATGWSRAMRDRAERTTRFHFLQTVIYWVQYIILVTILTLPWSLYTDFFREHQYGLSTQNIGGWIGDAAKALVVSLILGGIALGVLYMVVRRFPRSWATWGTVVGVAFLAIGVLIGPVFITPVFSKVTLLKDQRVLTPVLRMAHASGMMTNDIYVVDASRQSTRISANVSGMLGTQRITMNDNLLNRASLPEIEAVMGHELGHYVLNHTYKLLTFFTIILALAFMVLRRGFGWAQRRWGERWGVRDIADPAGLPLVVLIVTLFFFVLTPVLNTETRTTEQEADDFGLNAARQPDGFASVALKLSDYRKLSPGAAEEFIFFDHPSGRTRIMTAMRWKAEEAAR